MIFTFYSYKGGVGRTMALANIAELFYQAGLKVLMVDWDLEAPGLERFFQNVLDPEEILDHPGIIDMLLEYKKQMAQPKSIAEDEEETLPFENIEQYLISVYPPVPDKGELWLLPAGQRSEGYFSRYANAVLTFDWTDFYQNWEGERYFEWLRQQFNDMADVVLIDSRTGVTEMGGVCTYHLADTVVMFCAPNQQNLNGTYKMAQKFTAPEVRNSRGGRPLSLLVIPARIERAESKLLDEFQEEFIELFEDFVSQREGIDIQRLWQLAVPYIPKYAFTEAVAVREGDRASVKDMVTTFYGLSQLMVHLHSEEKLWRHTERYIISKKAKIAIDGEEDQSRRENVQKLIILQKRRLQRLKEQQALQGMATPPEIALEVMDIEEELRDLGLELAEIEAREERARAPLVYIHNFGEQPTQIPDRAYVVDWGDIFSMKPRTFPPPEVWEARLLPGLYSLSSSIGGPGLIRLEGMYALSTGLAFGYVFNEVAQYQLEVTQYSPQGRETWFSGQMRTASEKAPNFVCHQILGSSQAQDAIVIVDAIPSQSPNSLAKLVGSYWGEKGEFDRLFSGEGLTELENCKGVLFLEAEAASKDGRFIYGWEAVELARSSRRQLIDFVVDVAPERLHLFLAVPVGLAVFLGHQWHTIGTQVQCYEWVGGDEIYAPTCLLSL